MAPLVGNKHAIKQLVLARQAENWAPGAGPAVKHAPLGPFHKYDLVYMKPWIVDYIHRLL